MAWTAEVIAKETVGRVFRVHVQFKKDGVNDHTEWYETSQEQPAGWPSEQVKQHIRGLEGIALMPPKVSTGAVTLPADPTVDTAKEAWQRDVAKLELGDLLIRRGVLNSNNAKVATIAQRVTTNYKPEYLD